MSKITLNSGTQHQYTPSGEDLEAEIRLNKLSDVTLTNVQDDQVLQYNTVTQQWENTFVDALVTEVDGGAY
jgi:hypothetical protein